MGIFAYYRQFLHGIQPICARLEPVLTGGRIGGHGEWMPLHEHVPWLQLPVGDTQPVAHGDGPAVSVHQMGHQGERSLQRCSHAPVGDLDKVGALSVHLMPQERQRTIEGDRAGDLKTLFLCLSDRPTDRRRPVRLWRWRNQLRAPCVDAVRRCKPGDFLFEGELRLRQPILYKPAGMVQRRAVECEPSSLRAGLGIEPALRTIECDYAQIRISNWTFA